MAHTSASATWIVKKAMEDLAAHFVRVEDVTCAQLSCSAAFSGLTEQEALYAKHLHDASWAGAFICARQTSVEAVPLLSLLRLIYASGFDATKAVIEPIIGEDAFARFLAFSVEVISNLCVCSPPLALAAARKRAHLPRHRRHRSLFAAATTRALATQSSCLISLRARLPPRRARALRRRPAAY